MLFRSGFLFVLAAKFSFARSSGNAGKDYKASDVLCYIYLLFMFALKALRRDVQVFVISGCDIMLVFIKLLSKMHCIF